MMSMSTNQTTSDRTDFDAVCPKCGKEYQEMNDYRNVDTTDYDYEFVHSYEDLGIVEAIGESCQIRESEQ